MIEGFPAVMKIKLPASDRGKGLVGRNRMIEGFSWKKSYD